MFTIYLPNAHRTGHLTLKITSVNNSFVRCSALSTPPTTSKTSSLRQHNQLIVYLPKKIKMEKDIFRQSSPLASPPSSSSLHCSSGCLKRLTMIWMEHYAACQTACQRLRMSRWSTSGSYLHSLSLGLRCHAPDVAKCEFLM